MKIIISERQERLIKKNSIREKLVNQIKNEGWREMSDMVGGIKNLMKLLNINSPMDFLHLFDDLKRVQSEDNKNWVLFRYKPKYNFMVYDRKNEVVYINYDELWSFLEDGFELNYSEIQQVIQEWLGEVYNLRGVTTHSCHWQHLY